MDDERLDELLASAAPRPSREAELTAQVLAADIARPKRRVGMRRRRVLAGLLGVAALAGAGTTNAYWMSRPPYQGVPDGVERTAQGISVQYSLPGGGRRVCEVFVEFSNVTPQQRATIDEVVRSGPWEGLGKRLQVRGGAPIPGGGGRRTHDATVWIEAQLRLSVPEVLPSRIEVPPDGPHFTGSATSCRDHQEPGDAPS